MFPDDENVQLVKEHIFDPFEYLFAKHKDGELKTDFSEDLGKIFYHASCHLRVQKIGLKTRDVLSLNSLTQSWKCWSVVLDMMAPMPSSRNITTSR